MAKPLTTILSEINADVKLIEREKMNSALKLIFEASFIKEKKFDLPEGDPPYREDAAPIGMSPTNLYQELRRFYVFSRPDLPQVRREYLFIQLLESVHPDEARLLLAIKDQKLTKLYPKITRKLVTDAGFIPALEKEKK
jgi:hypothetical protein